MRLAETQLSKSAGNTRNDMHLGMGEIVVVLIIAMLVFGPSKLPQLGDALGKSIRAFKKATSGEDDLVEVHRNAERPQLVPPAASPSAGQEKVGEQTAAGRR
jgi:sec-independent protein translocase protein TatA